MPVPETVLEDYAFHTARVASGIQWPVLAIPLGDYRMTTRQGVLWQLVLLKARLSTLTR